MVIQWLDLLLGCLACVILHELILICVVLVLFMLTTIRSFFVFSLFWLIKLILVPINFVKIQKPKLVNMAVVSDALKPERFAGGDHFKRWWPRVKFWLMSMNI
jgi:hypothetical protein